MFINIDGFIDQLAGKRRDKKRFQRHIFSRHERCQGPESVDCKMVAANQRRFDANLRQNMGVLSHGRHEVEFDAIDDGQFTSGQIWVSSFCGGVQIVQRFSKRVTSDVQRLCMEPGIPLACIQLMVSFMTRVCFQD